MKATLIKKKCHEIYLVANNQFKQTKIESIVSYHYPNHRTDTVYIDVEVSLSGHNQILHNFMNSNTTSNLKDQAKELVENLLTQYYSIQNTGYTHTETLVAYQNDYWDNNSLIETIHVRNYKNNLSSFHTTRYTNNDRNVFYTIQDLTNYINGIEQTI